MELANSNILQDIHNYNFPHEQVHPDRFVNLIMDSLDNPVQCLSFRKSHKYSPSCNKRLETLSAIQVCFLCSHGMPDKSLSKCIDATNIERDQQVKDLDESLCKKTCESYNDSDAKQTATLTSWYRQVCKKLADEDFLLQLLQLQESSQCVFASHIIKKLICSCAVKYQKVDTVLRHIEDKWNRAKTVGGDELDLINNIVSSQRGGDEKNYLRKQVCHWLLESMSSLFSSLVTKLSQKKHDEFQENISLLSILGKVLKHCVSSGQEIPTSLGGLIVEILESHEDIFFSFVKSNNIKGQFLLIKFLKVVNKFITVPVCCGKVKTASIVLNCCDKILQLFPSMFEMCVSNGYMKTVGFTGDVHRYSGAKKQCGDQPRQLPNVVIARGMFLLAVKAAAVIVLTDDTVKDEFVVSFQAVWVCFESWTESRFEGARLDLGWIPLLLGDQDDQWIEVLLCLLLVYKEISPAQSFKEQGVRFDNQSNENESSTSKIIYSNNDASWIKPKLWYSLCPHKLFMQFLEFISFDPIVVSDFLMSPETNFLEYFSKYLAYLRNNWDAFVYFCVKDNERVKLKLTNSTISNHKLELEVEVEPSLTLKPNVMLSNKKEDIIQMDSGFISNKRKCDNLKGYPSNKMTKTNGFLSPLVSYADTDSDSDNPDESINECRPRVPDNEHTFINDSDKPGTKRTFESVNNVTCKKNDLVIGTFDADSVGTFLKAGDHRLSPPSSSCSLSDGEEKLMSNDEYEYTEKVMTRSHFESENILDSVMTMLIRLRFHIERLNNNHLFPYNVDFLLNLLSSCEDKYESI